MSEYIDSFQKLGDIVTKERKRKGLSQEALIGKLKDDYKVKISRNRLSKLENGSVLNGSDFELLRAYKEIFDCDYGYLFGEIKAPKQSTEYICNETGLSPQAVEFLQKQNNSDIVSSLITNPEFPVLCNIIRQLQDQERLNEIQAKLIVKMMKEKIGGKTFPNIDISTTLYSGAKDSLVRILDSFREEV